MDISVIICTHNPRGDYLQRTLDAIRAQVLEYERWELLLVDNASDEPVIGTHNVSWHPNARILVEEKLGLTPARLRGISESKGKILVFVDDDNLLSKDYLANALVIENAYPYLGAWGGSTIAEYEEDPPEWFKPYEGNIAVRRVEIVSWSNRYFDYESTPVGAGMCLRRAVARQYYDRISRDKSGVNLDRRGSTLMSCGDHDMAWTSIELGLGIGVFPELELIHIIPAGRTDPDYLLKLLEGGSCSSAILRERIMGNVKWPHPPKSFPRLRAFARSAINLVRQPKHDIHAKANQARARGMRLAKQMLESNKD